MDWAEIVVSVAVKDVETACDICLMAAPGGLYVEDYSNLEQDALEIARIDLIDEELLGKDRTKAAIHMYVDPGENTAVCVEFLKARFAECGIEFSVEIRGVNEKDWVENWKKYFKTSEIGDKLIIVPSWEEVPQTCRKVLKIDPGAAFGTGTHATTKLCLCSLERYVRQGARVLDVGTGSGILSIAAALLGAKSVLGIDIDDLAVKTARENGEVNGLSPATYIIEQGDLTSKALGEYDIILANIVADVVIPLCADVRPLLAPGGVFISSGIIENRADEVRDALRQSGFEIICETKQDGWYCFVGGKVC